MISTSPDSPCADCSAFLNWNEEKLESEEEMAIILRSLVATLKLQPTFDDSLEAKAVKFLESVDPQGTKSADAFLNSFEQTKDKSSTNFVQCIVVLLSTPNQMITTATMEMLVFLFQNCSTKIRLTFFKADLVAQLINSLNPLSLSFVDAVDIHINLMKIVSGPLWLPTPYGLRKLGIEDGNEQQAVHEIFLKQIISPSEQYICHWCMNRYSIIDGELSSVLLTLLAQLLRISQYYRPTMDFVLHMPMFFTIPSCLTFIKIDYLIWNFLDDMNLFLREWNETRGFARQMRTTVPRKLRMEGIEDVSEQRQLNNKNEDGFFIVVRSLRWNNQLGMNVPEQE
ncbi:hypothetical protein BLNAU_4776 [Blattamonas nauphoetae]|uniref:Uncharacterized protein n=1 Tax=Blattamonas nauphoetae TaxID=2049346 RepID=A0ABQ9Y8Y7_9EUKA|nr:hypothetical protein BLNAU_4776 [Blattamonas nauphoetae]